MQLYNEPLSRERSIEVASDLQLDLFLRTLHRKKGGKKTEYDF